MYRLVLFLCLASVICADDDTPQRHDLAWAQGLLRAVPELPRKAFPEQLPDFELGRAENAFREVVHTGGPTVDAYLGLAECRMRLCAYADAALSFRLALKLSPGNGAARDGLREADRRIRASAAIAKRLPRGHNVVQLEPFPGNARDNLWAVLSAKTKPPHLADGPYYVDLRLGIYRVTGSRCTRLSLSNALVDYWGRPGESSEAHLYQVDLTGDRAPELAVLKTFYGASWMPSHLEIFAWKGNRLAKMFGLRSDLPNWIADLNGDGRYELGNSYCIGQEMSHAEMPYWQDVYAWDGHRFCLANHAFPDQFTTYVGELAKLLSQYPNDYEIRDYLGRTLEILGRRDEALSAYREAVRTLDALLEDERDVKTGDLLDTARSQIRKRIQRLSRPRTGVVPSTSPEVEG